jgi:hypothetical protein
MPAGGFYYFSQKAEMRIKMKAGKKDLRELAEELMRQQETKRDFVADTRKVEMQDDGKTLAVGDEPQSSEFTKLINQDVKSSLTYFRGEATHHCHGQIASRLNIPFKYYQRMQAEAPDLLAANVNRWFNQDKEKRMIRTLDGQARAFLSERYRPLDNFDLAQSVLPKIQEMDCKIESCEVTPSRMYIKAITDRITAEVSKGDVVQAGIVISNSEVGSGSLKVEPLVLRLVCLNGMIANDSSMKKYHVGRSGKSEDNGASEFFRDETRVQDDKAFWMKVQDVVGASLDEVKFKSIVEKMQFAKELGFEDEPQKVIGVIAKKEGLTDKEQGGILSHLISGGELSAYGLSNAITRASQDVQDYDRATDLERLGGKVIELAQNNWKAYQAA